MHRDGPGFWGYEDRKDDLKQLKTVKFLGKKQLLCMILFFKFVINLYTYKSLNIISLKKASNKTKYFKQDIEIN